MRNIDYSSWERQLSAPFYRGSSPFALILAQRSYLTQMGVGFNAYYNNNHFHINRLRTLDEYLGNPWTGDQYDEAYLVSNGHVDPELNGGTISSLPPAPTSGQGGVLIGFAQFDGANTAAQDFVLTWDGDPTATFLVAGVSVTSTADNRVEFTTTPASLSYIILTALSSAVSNMSCHLASLDSNVVAGEIFNPEFLAECRKYDVLRHLDSLKTNQLRGRLTSQYSDVLNRGPQGLFTIATVFELAEQSDTAVWINIPPYLGAPDMSGVTDWDVFGENNAAAVLASSEWRAFADLVVAQMVARNYPLDKKIFVEVGNEIWNFSYPFGEATNFYRGIGRHLITMDGEHRYAYGYVSAMFANHFRDALVAAGRTDQQWEVALGTFTTVVATTTEAYAGAQYYIDNISANVPISKFGAATTGYYGEGMQHSSDVHNVGSSQATEADWLTAFNALAASDPDQLSANIRDFYISGTRYNNNVQNVLDDTESHRVAAEAAGGYFLGQYEGSCHDALYAGVNDAQLASTEYMTFRNNWLVSADHAAVVSHHNSNFRSQFPTAMLANFGDITPLSATGNNPAWSERATYADSNPVSIAWDQTLQAQSVRSAVSQFIFGHSLATFDDPEGASTQWTRMGEWLGEFASASGTDSTAGGKFGQLANFNSNWTTYGPPTDGTETLSDIQYTYPANTQPFMPDGTFAGSDFDYVMIMASNFGWLDQSPTGDRLTEALALIDNIIGEEPDTTIVVYCHWPDVPLVASRIGGIVDDENLTPAEAAGYWALTRDDTGTDGYLKWHIDWFDAITAARPNVNIQMIPVGPIIGDLLENESYLSTVTWGDMFSDNSPHGTEPTYALAALIMYRALFNQNPTLDSYTVPAGATQMVSEISSNLPALVAAVESRLSHYNNNGVRVY